MENIRQAVERARAGQSTGFANGADPNAQETKLSSSYLLSKRIVCHIGVDPRSRPYDMLRTQILQAMDVKGWTILGVTSPTPECGKTLTALNLAFSIARQPDTSVILVDLDLGRPQVAEYLGLKPAEGGVLGILEQRTTLQSAMTPVRADNQRLMVLPTAATKESSELMASRAMRALLQDVKKVFQSRVIILDLPPVLSSDDVIAILPQIDCVLLVGAVGISTVSEIEECGKHLHSTEVVRFVLNKATDSRNKFYKYYN